MFIPLVSALALLPSTPRVGAPATPAQLSPAARPAQLSEKHSFSASRRAALAGGAAALLCRAQRAVAGGINSGAPRLQDEKEDWAAGLSKETPQAQVKAGYAYLGKLLERMDEITAAEGGDGVRRYLGTVGTTSPVFGIQKVFLKLADVIVVWSPKRDAGTSTFIDRATTNAVSVAQLIQWCDVQRAFSGRTLRVDAADTDQAKTSTLNFETVWWLIGHWMVSQAKLRLTLSAATIWN